MGYRGRFSYLFVIVAIGALASAYAQTGSLTCDDAIKYHSYAVDAVGTCAPEVFVPPPPDVNTPLPCAAPPPPVAPTGAPVPLTLCDLIFQGRYNPNSSNYDPPVAYTNQISFLKPIGGQQAIGYVADWANRLVQNTLSTVADIGEVGYVLSQISAAWQFPYYQNLTMDSYYGAWQSAWWSQASSLISQANDTTNNWDSRSRMYTYWKAANYLYAGNWPSPYGQNAIDQSVAASAAFLNGIALHPTWRAVPVSVPFSNGTASANLPGILVTPNASQALPLIILHGGVGGTKEQSILQYGFQFLWRGYAVMAVEGPGKGATIKFPPYMPLYPSSQAVLATILDYIGSSLAQYVKAGSIGIYGFGKGGYFAARACSGNSDRLAVCIVNPPPVPANLIVSQYFEPLLVQKYYDPVAYAGQYNASTLPDGYAAAFTNTSDILDTLLYTCNASSGAADLLAQAYEEPNGFTSYSDAIISPDLIYIAGGYGGVVSDDEATLYGGLWQAFRNSQAFGLYDISNITCPVIAISGEEENLLSGQSNTWFDMLTPDVQSKSTQITLGATTGAALLTQGGSQIAGDAPLFAALDPIMQVSTNASSSAAPTQQPNAG